MFNAQCKGEFSSEMKLTHDLLDEINLPYGNLFEILELCEETRLAQKIALCQFEGDVGHARAGQKPAVKASSFDFPPATVRKAGE